MSTHDMVATDARAPGHDGAGPRPARPLGSPHATALLRDGLATARTQPVATITAALVVALVCVVVLATTGRAAATEHQVVASIDAVGTRTITVTDATGTAGIAPSAVDAVTRLTGVTWVFGMGAATDAHAGQVKAGPGGVPLREYTGSLPPDLELVRGRLPQRPGEAVAGTGALTRLGLLDGAGPVTTRTADGEDRQVAVVGQVHATGPLAHLDDTVLVATDDDVTPLRYLYVLADTAAHVPALTEAVTAVLPATHPDQVQVDTSSGLLALRDVVSGSLGASSRQLMAGVLVAGIVLIAVTMLAAVSARRRDFGRRRALGASRSAIVTLVLVHSALAATAGAVTGVAAGLGIIAVTDGALPAWTFSVGLAALVVLVTLAGSVPPALAAAWRDPVRVLRVP